MGVKGYALAEGWRVNLRGVVQVRSGGEHRLTRPRLPVLEWVEKAGVVGKSDFVMKTRCSGEIDSCNICFERVIS